MKKNARIGDLETYRLNASWLQWIFTLLFNKEYNSEIVMVFEYLAQNFIHNKHGPCYMGQSTNQSTKSNIDSFDSLESLQKSEENYQEWEKMDFQTVEVCDQTNLTIELVLKCNQFAWTGMTSQNKIKYLFS